MDEAIEVIRQRFTEDRWKDCELHRVTYGADGQYGADVQWTPLWRSDRSDA